LILIFQVSVSNDLKYDAERDLRDIGAHGLDVHFLSKMKYGKINSSINGYIKKGVMYATYSAVSLIFHKLYCHISSDKILLRIIPAIMIILCINFMLFLKPCQNTKERKFVSAAPKMVSFFSPFLVHLKQILGPSYFVTSLIIPAFKDHEKNTHGSY
jgi:hypothetical protein